jgi:hypothetical protein
MTAVNAKRSIAGGLLGGLILALFLTALTRTPPIPEDVTGFLQAESLRLDRDLTYGDEDYRRFAARWPDLTPRLALYRNSNGLLRYDRPAIHALLASPFTILGPRGPLVLNTLLLALAAFIATRVFGKKLGWVGVLLVTLFIFSSSVFALVFQATPAILLLLSGVGAFGLIFGGEFFARDPRGHEEDIGVGPSVVMEAVRWVSAGVLVGVAVLHHPIYLLLALAAALVVPKKEGPLGWPALAAGALTVILLSTYMQRDGGIWLGSAAARGDTSVEAPESVDTGALGRVSRASLESLGPRLDGELTKWNLIYFLGGRHVGVLVYFLPVMLIFLAGEGTSGRRYVILFCLLGALAFVFLQPFGFSGGGLGNVYFLPFYGALWYDVTRYSALVFGLAILVVSAIALFPLWRSPSGPAQLADGSYRHVSPLVAQYLPVETTQKNLFRGTPSFAGGVWIRQLSGAPPGLSEMMLVGNSPGEILIASPEPIHGLQLSFPGLGSDRIELIGGQPGSVSYSPDGGLVFGVELTSSARQHPMWWSDTGYHLYSLGLRLPEASSQAHTFDLLVAE